MEFLKSAYMYLNKYRKIYLNVKNGTWMVDLKVELFFFCFVLYI